MAVTGTEIAASAGWATSFTMSLTRGWDEIPPERAGRSLCAGDVVVLAVLSPAGPVQGPPDWVACEDGRTFWKMIGPNEMDPTFRGQGSGAWAVKGWALSGYEGASPAARA